MPNVVEARVASRMIAGLAAAICTMLVTLGAVQAETSPAFRSWLATFRAEALSAGISAATFDRVMRDIKINRRAPDLVRPGAKRKRISNRGQAEFTRPPQAYLKASQLARLAKTGRRLARKHSTVLRQIERELSVPASVVLAIWGRETAFGGWRLRHDAINALTTQAWLGRRKALFRAELIDALRMIDQAGIPRARMRSSWAGAVGLTQFMPSEYFSTAYDLDRDGTKDLWSPPDALASAANQLKLKGWMPDRPWGIEVRIGGQVDCAMAGPQNTMPIRDWAARGLRQHNGKPFSDAALDWPAYLLVAGGTYGPVFLVTENYVVFRRYNLSDLYALFVGDLANRIAGRGTFRAPWADLKQVRGAELAEIQTALKELGYGISKIDGKLGSNTRSQIGLYQRASGAVPDCWPTRELLAELRTKMR
ncbi:MAG: lytic murein transglycosylase [Pseudomonadota bacterium]